MGLDYFIQCGAFASIRRYLKQYSVGRARRHAHGGSKTENFLRGWLVICLIRFTRRLEDFNP